MKLSLKDESGASVILFALVISVVIGFMVAAVMFGILNFRQQAARYQKGSESLMMVQQLGAQVVMARNQYMGWAGSAGACDPTQHTVMPTTGTSPAFCFPLGPSVCVSSPGARDFGVSAGGPRDGLRCFDVSSNPLSGANEPYLQILPVIPGMAVTLNVPRKNKNFMSAQLEKLKLFIEDSSVKVAKFILFELTDTLYAQRVFDDFNFVGAPAAPALAAFPGACGANFCRRCHEFAGTSHTGAYRDLPPESSLVCSKVRVCPKRVPCDVNEPSEWVVQMIGVLKTL